MTSRIQRWYKPRCVYALCAGQIEISSEPCQSISKMQSFRDHQIMVKLELNLPWKPILAWPWGVQYTIDPETNLIVDHKESWDIEALEGVKQIFRKPTVTI